MGNLTKEDLTNLNELLNGNGLSDEKLDKLKKKIDIIVKQTEVIEKGNEELSKLQSELLSLEKGE